MARNQNSQTKQRIMHEAWRQFRSAGYAETTYASLAKACKVGRSLVQYHFERKEDLAVSLLSWVLEESQRAQGIDEARLRGNHIEFYRVGCCAFSFLLGDHGFSRFMLEVLESRSITEAILTSNVQWNVDRIPTHAGIEYGDIDRVIVMAMGAFYDYTYHCLSNGTKPDVFACLSSLTYLSAVALEGENTYSPSDFRRDGEYVRSIEKAASAVAVAYEQIVKSDSACGAQQKNGGSPGKEAP